MNEHPDRERQQPESDPEDNDLSDEDLLAHDELDFGDGLDDAVEDDAASVAPEEAPIPLPISEAGPEPVEEPVPEPIVAPDVEVPALAIPAAVLPPSRYQRRPRPELQTEPAAIVEDEPVAEETAVERPGPFTPRSRPERRNQNQAAQVFTTFRPESNTGSVVGVAIVLFCFAAGAALIYRSFDYDPSLGQLWPLMLGAIFLTLSGLAAYWTWGSISLSYMVDRNSLSIRWGAQRQIVPLVNIERLIPSAADAEAPSIEGVHWPGHHVGKAQVPQLGEVLFYSGHRTMSDVLYVQTSTETYAISVPDPVSFAEAVQSNQMRGPLFEQRQVVHRDGIAAQSFWIDPQARFLTIILLASFVMVLGYVLQTYPGLAQSVPLRFPALGAVIRVTDKSELLDIPRSAAAFLSLNLVLAVVLHPWERMVSIVLLLAGIAIQLALLVAAIVAVA